MANTPRLALPYIVAGQAQKEITHNDALNDLDSLTQLSVINRTTSTPPVTPSEGDGYIIGASPTGAWSGNANAIAFFYSGWRIKTAKEGWLAYVQAEGVFYLFDGSAWNIFKEIPPLGSASAPAYSFVGDSDTGMYSPGANQVAIATAGVQRFSINAAGDATFSGAITATGIINGNVNGNASSVTTNANMSGDVTSVGNITTVAKIAGVAVGTPTGTGNVVYSASPTLTGTMSAVTANFSGVVTVNNNLKSSSSLLLGAGTTFPYRMNVNSNTGNVISTGIPGNAAFVGADGQINAVQSITYGNSPGFSAYRSNGTYAAPTAIVSGDVIGSYQGAGYNGVGQGSGAIVRMVATENWSSTAGGSAVTFETISNGTTARTEKLRLDGSGNLNILGTLSLNSKQAVNGPAFSAYLSAAQVITTATLTKVAFNTEEFDTNANFDAVTNFRFTPNVGGYYQINANVNFAAASTAAGTISAYLYKNGTLFKTLAIALDSNATQLEFSGNVVVQMNGTTDYVELYVQQTSGANQSLGSGASGTVFSGSMIRGL